MEQKIETTQPYTTAIPLSDLTEKDLYWLTIACGVGYTGYNTTSILRQAAEGYLQLRRIDKGGAEGIFTVRIETHPAGREYKIECLAGKNIIRSVNGDTSFIGGELKDLAREHECRFIAACANNKILEKLYARLLEPQHRHVTLIAEV